jgi:hypothetical protein
MGALRAITAIAMLAVATVATAAELGIPCQATKLRAVGREARDQLHCWGLGTIAQLTPECFQSASARRDQTFVRSESRLTCLTSGDSTDIGERVSSYASTQLSALQPTDGSFGSTCTRAKLEAAGRRFEKVAKSYASDAVRPNPSRLAARIAKADARYLAAFLAADSLINCQRSGDGPYELERNNVWIIDFRHRLFPQCGDGIAVGAEECDGSDSAACPGTCSSACTCARCGNGVHEPGEQCDGADDTFCPGQCASDCTCPGPVCGDGVVGGTEQCDGSLCSNDPTFPLGCFPPGDPQECQCCALSICYVQDAGYFVQCCPGMSCYIDPVPAPHKLGYCVTP